MNGASDNKSGWRWARRFLVVAACLGTLVAIFYAEEDWRGKRAWENCKRELEAKGVELDWDKLIPPPVPDDQNFFKAPKMAEWFIKNRQSFTNELSDRLRNADTVATNLNEAFATKYLAWSDQFAPDFDLIREALKRPYTRMNGDYSKPYEQPIPNFVTVRIVAQTLAQRAKCDLLLSRPNQALQELTLLHDMCRLLEGAPTGKPMTLVAAMINVAVTGLYVDTIAGGLQSHAWQEPQLLALQQQLADINLTPFVMEALHQEPAAVCKDIMISPYFKFMGEGRTTFFGRIEFWLWPRGWTYQNLVNVVELEWKPLSGFDVAHNTVSPSLFDESARSLNKFFARRSPYKNLAAIVIPNFTKAEQTTAYNQTLVNEEEIACTLERYRLAHGEYPKTLDALVPQFMEKIPHDIIGGQPLHYRHTNDQPSQGSGSAGGKFLLYSVGWNEKDDGGLPGTLADVKNGDWVWR